jgi:hypothetical protein
VSFDGTTYKCFTNGVLKQSSTTLLASHTFSNFRFGTYSGTTSTFNGYMSDIRYNTTCLYTAAFTPPTAPLTAIANTQLLLSGTNASIYDASGHLPVETMGNACLSTTQSKFGGSSMYFDGTAGCFAKMLPGSLNFGTADFTIDFWYYKVANVANASLIYGGDNVTPATSMNISDNSGTLLIYLSSNGTAWDVGPGTSGGTITTGAWNHICIRRVGSIFSTFINGVLTATITSALGIYNLATNTPVIGGTSSNGRNVNGYIDDFRITIGKGRYTVEPTSALTL